MDSRSELIHIDSHSTPQIVTSHTFEAIREMPKELFSLHKECPEVFVEEVYEAVVDSLPSCLSMPLLHDVLDALIDNQHLIEEVYGDSN